MPLTRPIPPAAASPGRFRAVAAAMLLATGLAFAGPARATQPDGPAGLDDRIALAARYLHAQIGAGGQMVYRRDALSGDTVPGRYNLLRHAGTLLALAEYHLEHPPTPQEAQRMAQGLRFLRGCCMAPSAPGADDLAVWSDPATVGGRRSYPVAKLGGAGLTLAAMAQWRRVQPDAVALRDMQALGRFILSMQGADGRFRSLHAHQAGEHDPDWVSLYYPGEAALGLLLLHEHDPDPRWLEAATDALRALARERETLQDPPPDHWALLATARLWQQAPAARQAALPHGFAWDRADSASEGTALAPLLLEHGLSVARLMLREQAAANDPAGCAPGAFTPDGRTTPTATRLEGLLALLAVLPHGPERDAVWQAARAGMGFLLRAQYLEGPATGAFSRVSPACPSGDRRASEVRIDYVQHAMAALQAYRALLRSTPVVR